MRTKKQTSEVTPISNAPQRITSEPAAEPAQPTTVKIEESESKELVDLDKEMAGLKQSLSETQLKIMLLEAERTKTAQKYFEANNAFHVKVKDIAEKYGIDMNAPEKGRWNLDITSGVFTKVG